MGIVYEAVELESGRTVALKVLAADLSIESEAFERFRREARLAAAISDARCVFVYGAHQVDESPAIAMELVGGETLQEKIARGDVIPIETAVRWTIDVIDGLEAVHRAGVLHRDVKPSNCFGTLDGQVKIGDFGLSRTLERDVELTQSGQFLGSPLYASPEQIRGRVVDARSDQYSCAATLYALLTSKSPFSGSNVGEVLARILSEPPATPRSVRPAIPRRLEKIVLRGMERDPEKRFRDLEAMRAALFPFSSSAAAAATIPRRLGAWLVDFSIIAFTAGYLSALVQTSHGMGSDQARPWLAVPFGTQIALACLPILYFALFEGLFASTAGKWLFGLRVAPVGRGPALPVRTTIRAALYEAPYILLMFPVTFIPNDPVTYAWSSLTIPLGAVLVRLSTMRKRNGWRGPYELLSGTRVVQSKLPFRRLRRAAPPPERAPTPDPALPERLGEYEVLGLVGLTGSGLLMHARDAKLERNVWIQIRTTAPPAGDWRRSLARPTRLRWLECPRAAAIPADVFESPGGCGLADLALRGEPLEWSLAERALVSLAEELARCEEESGARFRGSPNQVWIDRNWNVRLLDEPVPHDDTLMDSTELLGAAAHALLAVGPRRELPPDLPVHAEALVRALTGSAEPFTDLGAARTALTDSQAAAASVERRHRSSQLAVSTLLISIFLAFSFVLYLVFRNVVPHAIEMHALLDELQEGSALVVADGQNLKELKKGSRGPVLDEEGLRLRQIALSYELSNGIGPNVMVGIEPGPRELCDRALQEFPNPSEAEMESAMARIREQRHGRIDQSALPWDWITLDKVIAGFVAAGAALWTMAALISCCGWPGGLSFRLFGLSIRSRNGRRARRWLGLVRVLAFGLPLTAGYAGSVWLLVSGFTWGGWALFVLTAAAHVAGVVLSIATPSRGPVDRLLGTRIVPR